MQAELSRVANESGTIAISVVSSLDPAVVERAGEIIGPDLLLAVDAAALPRRDVDAAAAICRLLASRGVIAAQPSSLMGGDGI
jgi:hypothetical protein